MAGKTRSRKIPAVTEPTPAKFSASEVARQHGNTPAVRNKWCLYAAVMKLGGELADEPGTMAEIWNALGAGKQRADKKRPARSRDAKAA
jgi:hypothetical protein